jgi:hypothetical protein
MSLPNVKQQVQASGSIPSTSSGNSAPITGTFGGKIPTATAFIKQFYASSGGNDTWYYKNKTTIQSLTANVYISGDLTVDGTIVNASDLLLKENIQDISQKEFENVLKIQPKKYHFKDDSLKKEHYGVIAQELELLYPELIREQKQEPSEDQPDKTKKYVNYLEIIPLLIGKMKQMQQEIDELKETIKKKI